MVLCSLYCTDASVQYTQMVLSPQVPSQCLSGQTDLKCHCFYATKNLMQHQQGTKTHFLWTLCFLFFFARHIRRYIKNFGRAAVTHRPHICLVFVHTSHICWLTAFCAHPHAHLSKSNTRMTNKALLYQCAVEIRLILSHLVKKKKKAHSW